MYTTHLRKVGGSVMLVVPPALLEALELRVGVEVDIGVEGGRLIVVPRTRPSYTLNELPAQCQDSGQVPDDGGSWLGAGPVGKELL